MFAEGIERDEEAVLGGPPDVVVEHRAGRRADYPAEIDKASVWLGQARLAPTTRYMRYIAPAAHKAQKTQFIEASTCHYVNISIS